MQTLGLSLGNMGRFATPVAHNPRESSGSSVHATGTGALRGAEVGTPVHTRSHAGCTQVRTRACAIRIRDIHTCTQPRTHALTRATLRVKIPRLNHLRRTAMQTAHSSLPTRPLPGLLWRLVATEGVGSGPQPLLLAPTAWRLRRHCAGEGPTADPGPGWRWPHGASFCNQTGVCPSQVKRGRVHTPHATPDSRWGKQTPTLCTRRGRETAGRCCPPSRRVPRSARARFGAEAGRRTRGRRKKRCGVPFILR